MDKFDIILGFIDIIVVYCLFSPPDDRLLSTVSSPNGRFLIFAGDLFFNRDKFTDAILR
ncbi:unknown protein [Microcystis aeruginosa NIES-843]|jgi:hypothetical protein|uniref:Uncharacterized protein n=1 Tax=Microcystis aeruginosa (strain NIES-843 / IAM M-2473) TaxID=449447 RepID=B0JSQ2_MICAN|nr:unknown protein [Microcystis aeruginosa NIES-843]